MIQGAATCRGIHRTDGANEDHNPQAASSPPRRLTSATANSQEVQNIARVQAPLDSVPGPAHRI
jgi:hypothetical protein